MSAKTQSPFALGGWVPHRYKHWPFFVKYNPADGLFCGLLYDTHAPGVFDFGKERSAFRGEYRYYRGEGPVDLDYYVIIADSLALVRDPGTRCSCSLCVDILSGTCCGRGLLDIFSRYDSPIFTLDCTQSICLHCLDVENIMLFLPH